MRQQTVGMRPTIPDMLGGIKMTMVGLPNYAQAHLQVWLGLWADTKCARAEGRTPFTYLELVSVKLLPPWLPPASVGGQAAIGLDPSAASGDLASLSTALRGAMASPRYFRSLQQWSVVFWRWAPIAIATEQMTLVQVVIYHSVVMQLAEEMRVSAEQGSTPLLALAYDMVARESWAARCSKADPDFDMDEAVAKVDERFLATARTRYALMKSSGSGGGRGGAQALPADGEAAMARSAAAAAVVNRRATEAAKQLAAEAATAQSRQQAAAAQNKR